jgi:hypothetical protein
MTKIVFLDTETTSLRPDRRAWEVGLIVRDPGQPDDGAEHHWFIDAADLDLANADPMSLKIGGFYERHPFGSDGDSVNSAEEADVADWLEAVTRGAHIVGGVPNFDTEVLGAMLRRQGLCPGWHYHLCDFENLIVGYLRGCGPAVAGEGWPFLPPWNSAALSRAIGVEPPCDADRHTALGDARWAARVWDRVMGDSTP